jgi:hypothetical protein
MARKRAFPDVDRLPFDNAIARMLPTLDTNQLARHELRELMHSDQLESAIRWIAGGADGTMLTKKLDASFWETHLLDEEDAGKVVVRRLDRSDPDYLGAAYFVNGRQFDKLYPTKPAERADNSNRPSRGDPPGPESTKNWRLEVARELLHRAEAGETRLSAAKMIQWCKDKIGYKPDDSDMRKLLKYLRERRK